MTQTNLGWFYGLIGVIIFAGSLPATRIAVVDFSPEFLTFARASIAGSIALLCLLITKQKIPNFQQLKSLIIIILSIIIGFPLFTALALQTITSAYSTIFIGILPLFTALFAVFRAHEKPKALFWLFTLLGTTLIIIFILFHTQDRSFKIGDIYMILSILVCGLGYAEGGKLSRELGGWQVTCWALTVSFPFMLFFGFYYFPSNLSMISHTSFMGLLYVSIFSTLIGFFFWYKGLGLGGIAKVGQIQLIQPFISFIFAAFLLHEKIEFSMLIISILVLLCVFMAKKHA